MAGDRLAERGAAGILYISTQPGLFFAPVAMLIYVPAEQYAAVLDAVAGEVLAEARLDARRLTPSPSPGRSESRSLKMFTNRAAAATFGSG